MSRFDKDDVIEVIEDLRKSGKLPKYETGEMMISINRDIEFLGRNALTITVPNADGKLVSYVLELTLSPIDDVRRTFEALVEKGVCITDEKLIDIGEYIINADYEYLDMDFDVDEVLRRVFKDPTLKGKTFDEIAQDMHATNELLNELEGIKPPKKRKFHLSRR